MFIFYLLDLGGTQAGGSPLEARGNPIIYASLLIGLGVVAVFGLVSLFVVFRKRLMMSPEWIEKEKARPTRYSDIERFSKVYYMKPEELQLLWYICKKYKVLNIYYSIRHFNDMDRYFKAAYDDFKAEKNERKVSKLFALKFDLDKIFTDTVNIPSTAYLPKGSKTSLLLKDGTKIRCVVDENNRDFVAIAFSDGDMAEKPAPMSKTAFTFLSPIGTPYAFVTRLIRYETRGDKTVMILSHSSDLIKKTQRKFKRKNVSEPCQYSSVIEGKDKNGEPTYTPAGKKYSSLLQNISGGGCCISSNLPIKEGQLIATEFNFFDGSCTAYGKIVKTRKAPIEDSYNLHIRFIKISLEVQNKILAKVYSYE